MRQIGLIRAIEREIGPDGNYLEVYDEMPKVLEAVRECLKPIALGEEWAGTRWRILIIGWVRMKLLQKMADPVFLNRAFDSTVGRAILDDVAQRAAGRDEANRLLADAYALAIAESVLDEILKVK